MTAKIEVFKGAKIPPTLQAGSRFVGLVTTELARAERRQGGGHQSRRKRSTTFLRSQLPQLDANKAVFVDWMIRYDTRFLQNCTAERPPTAF
jgi:hypothetical protein